MERNNDTFVEGRSSETEGEQFPPEEFDCLFCRHGTVRESELIEQEQTKARSDLLPKVVEALEVCVQNLTKCPDDIRQLDHVSCSDDMCCWERECELLTTAQALLSVASGQGDSADTISDELCVECGEGCVGCHELGINAPDEEGT